MQSRKRSRFHLRKKYAAQKLQSVSEGIMKKVVVIITALLVVGAGVWAFLLKPRADRTYGTVVAAEVQTEEDSVAAEPFYTVKHRWSEKPRVGTVTLTFIVFEPAGGKAQDVDVVVCTGMPLQHEVQSVCERMQQNPRGVFRHPIPFTERGDWEIRLSIEKGGREVESRTIEVTIEE
jgi:hypothetical protein